MRKYIFLITYTLLTMMLLGCSHPNDFIKNNNIANQKSTLNVTIANGTIPSPTTNVAQKYQPIVFAIKNGNCTKTNITLTNNENVTLKTCFIGNVLLVDTEKTTRTSQTIRFYYNPLWQQGYTYQNITSNGQVHLTNADVQIKTI